MELAGGSALTPLVSQDAIANDLTSAIAEGESIISARTTVRRTHYKPEIDLGASQQSSRTYTTSRRFRPPSRRSPASSTALLRTSSPASTKFSSACLASLETCEWHPSFKSAYRADRDAPSLNTLGLGSAVKSLLSNLGL